MKTMSLRNVTYLTFTRTLGLVSLGTAVLALLYLFTNSASFDPLDPQILKVESAYRAPGRVFGVTWSDDGKYIAALSDLFTQGMEVAVWPAGSSTAYSTMHLQGSRPTSSLFFLNKDCIVVPAPLTGTQTATLSLISSNEQCGSQSQSISFPGTDKPVWTTQMDAPAQSHLVGVIGREGVQARAVVLKRPTLDVHTWPTSLGNPSDAPEAISISNDGSICAIGYVSGRAEIHDLKGSTPTKRLVGFTDTSGSVASAAISPGNDAIALGAAASMRAHRLPTGQWQQIVEPHPLRIWSLTDPSSYVAPAGAHQPIRRMAWAGDGKYLIFGSGDQYVYFWKRGANSVKRYGLPNQAQPICFAVSPDGSQVAIGTSTSVLVVSIRTLSDP